MSESDTSSSPASSLILRYGLAFVSVAAALIVTHLLRPDVLVAPIFFLAIILSAWIGGFGPGLIAAVLGTLAVSYFYLPPLYTLRISVGEIPHLLVFFLSAFLVSSWSSLRSRAETLLRQARDELEVKVQERTADLSRSNEQLQAEIAERKRAEEVLQEQALELRDQAQLLELAHDGILVRNLASEILFWNHGAERMYGWTKEEAIGETTHTFLKSTFPGSFEHIQAEIHGKGHWEGELVHTKRDGSLIVVASRQVLQRDQSGNPVAILEINSDITERKRAEDEVRDQASLLNLTHDTIFVRGMNNAITYWNRGAEELYGWTREEAIGQISHQLMHTTFPAPLDDITKELLGTGRWEGELTHTKRDGTKAAVASRWALQLDEQGNAVAILETNNDITERKQAEEALQKSQAELAHVTRVTTLGELTASIAHEVNQPLAAVVTNGNACLRWLAHEPPNLIEAQQAVGRIIKDGHRASEVIGRIRKLVKKAPQRKVQVDINDIVYEVVALAQSELQRNRVSLLTQVPEGLPLVVGDRIQLQQVILNLILNGIEAMSGLLDKPRELVIKAGKDDSNGVLVAVRDSGTGLESTDPEHLFDAFYTTKTDGMGMGLAISRSIIESHGGRLWATANSPRGAVFQFTLPAQNNTMP